MLVGSKIQKEKVYLQHGQRFCNQSRFGMLFKAELAAVCVQANPRRKPHHSQSHTNVTIFNHILQY